MSGAQGDSQSMNWAIVSQARQRVRKSVQFGGRARNFVNDSPIKFAGPAHGATLTAFLLKPALA
jgi:hypothetical protein